mmetsp:Transcript_41408/g.103371  ORF Transcript_41408/g.103371 Transcript_41408/m.103371 type:complete len:212 (+) Transcript_41408:1386-2021(+)
MAVVRRLEDGFGSLVDDFLEEVGQFLLGLELPGEVCAVVLLFEEGRRQHVGEEPQGEGQGQLAEWDDDEEGEGDELEHVGGRPHQQLVLAVGQRQPRELLLDELRRHPDVGHEQGEPRVDPLTPVDSLLLDVVPPLDQHTGVATHLQHHAPHHLAQVNRPLDRRRRLLLDPTRRRHHAQLTRLDRRAVDSLCHPVGHCRAVQRVPSQRLPP